ncbi:MAG: hypothetical protein ACQBVK_01835, partial [Candidatus Phytoplasma sp. TWB_XP]
MTLTLHPGAVSLADLEHLYWTGEAARLDPSFDPAIRAPFRWPIWNISTGQARPPGSIPPSTRR